MISKVAGPPQHSAVFLLDSTVDEKVCQGLQSALVPQGMVTRIVAPTSTVAV